DAGDEKSAALAHSDDNLVHLSRNLGDQISRRQRFLIDYQDASYAKQYTDFVARVEQVESGQAPGRNGLAQAVAKYLFKVMAYKD
ncbi:MAG: hypothetical protein KDI71_01285, partial [Xanthomonadales bacterium]|nr:hypothetical protein [Xanthomonadales bacterium]